MSETGNQEFVEIKVAPVANERIVIPPGEFQAPRDHEIKRTSYLINGVPRSIDLIQQTYQGNCAEYTALNAAIVLSKEGFAVNPAVTEYLQAGTRMDLDLVENELIIPFLLNGQEDYKFINTTVADVNNLEEKTLNPYVALTNANSALLFRMAVSPETVDFEQEDLVTEYSDKVENRIKSNETLAIFIGSGNHATCYIKLGPDFLYIDPYFNDGVITSETQEQALQRLRRVADNQGSFITLNELRVK